MDVVTILTSPTVLLFAILLAGYFVGKIKVWGISLDLSAVLIAAIVAGFLIAKLEPGYITEAFAEQMGTYSKLGTALFVAAVGIAAGFSLQNGIGERDFFYFSVGVLMVIAGILGMRVVSCLDATMDQSLLMGLLCGAMTSTPGLSAACEVEGVLSELAILGYGCAYPFGVISTVVFAQLMTRNAKMIGKKNIPIQKKGAVSGNMSVESLIPIGIAVILGSVVGQTKLPYMPFSLGNSGGILCVGILVGFLLAKVRGNFDAINNALSFYRNFGLVIFFVGSGVSAGMTLHLAFEVKWFAYGALFTVLPVLCGYWICRSILRQTLDKSMCIVAGGMTSTPTLGLLLRNPNLAVDLSAYSMAYVGALLTMVLCIGL